MGSTTLQPCEELRFEVGVGAEMTVELTNGMAEIFGAEMAPRRKYTFSGTQQAV